jgi:hypothetical protein
MSVEYGGGLLIVIVMLMVGVSSAINYDWEKDDSDQKDL